MSKQDLQNKIEEIRQITFESFEWDKLDTPFKMFKAYERSYKRILIKLGDLELIIDDFKGE